MAQISSSMDIKVTIGILMQCLNDFGLSYFGLNSKFEIRKTFKLTINNLPDSMVMCGLDQ
ncbi:MAG: hypothetical protein RLZZ419_1683 [Pseudomonadota bacterium]|jgi:hypothetical protein